MAETASAKDVFNAWQKAVNDQDWHSASFHLAGDVTYNGESSKKLEQDLRATWNSATNLQSEVDTLVVDSEGNAVAARVVHRGTLTKPIYGITVTGKPIEWAEHIFIWTSNHSKISRINSLIDTQHQASENLPRTPSTLQQRPLSSPSFSLSATYHSYMSALNGPSIREELPQFYHHTLTHNANPISVTQLADFVEKSPLLFEGLKLSVADLLADSEGKQVAVRVLFEGVPLKPFFELGPPPHGEKKKVSFYEHCIYKFDGDKFTFIWAMLDLSSYKEQVQ